MAGESQQDAGAVSDELLKPFRGQLARGELILFTGAGFALDAVATDGQTLPSVVELRKILWPIAFPDEAVDDSSLLGDVFECALSQNASAVRREMERCLRVDSDKLPDAYRLWFSMPWRRIYTLNIDDLDEAVSRRFDLPVPITSVSSLSDALPDERGTASVHLNGTLRDLPDVTFSAPQYGERLPGRDPWYSTLVAELMGSPVLFVGTELDESTLWQHIALRGERIRQERELRPRSYLITPRISAARRRLLRSMNIEHIPMTHAEFAERVLSGLPSEANGGHQAIAARRGGRKAGSPLRRVAELRGTEAPSSLADYLLGREPTFKDVTNGFAVEREFERGLAPNDGLIQPRLIAITGTAGTGKSTTLIRLCLELQAAGRDVYWLDRDTSFSLQQLRREIRRVQPDVLAMDDVDAFGPQAGRLMVELLGDAPELRLLVACRSTRFEGLEIRDSIREVDHEVLVVPPLGDADIVGVVDALTRAGRLGRLKGKPVAEQHTIFRDYAGRQLLVAMIEATSGQRFEDRVDEECRELSPGQALAYATVALATRFRRWLRAEEVILAVGGDHYAALADLEALKRQHLVIERAPDQLWVRHRVIAERATGYFRREHQLGPIVEGLLFAMATKIRPGMRPTERVVQIAARLLNHRFMIEEIGNLSIARGIYERVEQVLADDRHFWLQRGSIEVEVGDLHLAENYLNQARGLAEDDPFVQTEWAYMSLKRAAHDAATGEPGWRGRAEQAFEDLRDAIRQRGQADSYPYHVLGSQGLAYVRRAPLSEVEKATLLAELVALLKNGRAAHPGAADVRKLLEDLEKEYLMLAVTPERSSDEV